HLIEYGIIGFLGFAVVPAIARLLAPYGEGWIAWANNVAYASLLVTAVGNIVTIPRIRLVFNAYVAGDASTKAALGAVWQSPPEPGPSPPAAVPTQPSSDRI